MKSSLERNRSGRRTGRAHAPRGAAGGGARSDQARRKRGGWRGPSVSKLRNRIDGIDAGKGAIPGGENSGVDAAMAAGWQHAAQALQVAGAE